MTDVEIMLRGKPVALAPTLTAAKRVNAISSGFSGVLVQLASFNLEAYVGIVAAGLNKKANEVEEDVFATGLPNLTEKLTEFVILLSNGGEPLAGR